MVRAYEGREPYIFISYSHLDSDVVSPCIDALYDRSFRVWYDNGIEAGTEWPEYIAERMMSAEAVIAFMSKNAQNSHNCRREINFAIELKKPLLVIYLEDFELTPGMRLQLGTLQAMFYYKSPTKEEFFERLSRAAILDACLDRSRVIQVSSPLVADTAPAHLDGQNVVLDQLYNEDVSSQVDEEGLSVEEEPGDPRGHETEAIQIDRRSLLLSACAGCNRVHEANHYSFVFKPVSELKERQIANACRTFGNGLKRDDIVALLDDTLMQTGKAGLLLTEDRLISRQWLFPFAIDLNNLVSFGVSQDKYVDITYRDNSTESYYFGLSRDAFLEFFKIYVEGTQV